MRDDTEKFAESKCRLPPWDKAAKQPLKRKKKYRKRRWMNKRGAKHPTLAGIPAGRENWQTWRELRETFLLLSGPSCPFLRWQEIAIVWHVAPVGPGCYKPAVKCDALCHGCALRLLLLFGCEGIRAGTQGSTVHPKEGRFHIPEWNAFWHSSASPWFE